MTISSFLNASFQFLVKLAQSNMMLFLTLAIAMLGLYGVVTIIIQLVCFFKR